jgi:hypothetical protein
MVRSEDAAVGCDGQIAEDVIITLTTSPSASDEVVNIDEFVPSLFPFTIH